MLNIYKKHDKEYISFNKINDYKENYKTNVKNFFLKMQLQKLNNCEIQFILNHF